MCFSRHSKIFKAHVVYRWRNCVDIIGDASCRSVEKSSAKRENMGSGGEAPAGSRGRADGCCWWVRVWMQLCYLCCAMW